MDTGAARRIALKRLRWVLKMIFGPFCAISMTCFRHEAGGLLTSHKPLNAEIPSVVEAMLGSLR